MTTRSSQCRLYVGPFLDGPDVDAVIARWIVTDLFAHEITDVLRVPRHALDQASGAISTG